MSVPTWKRKLSSTEYLHKLFELNKEIASIVMKKPSKYRVNYGDYLIKTSLEALKLGQIANRTYVIDDISYEVRRSALLKLQGEIDNIATVGYIFLELVRQSDSIKSEKIFKEENKIGDACNQISKMVGGVIRYDREKYKKLKDKG